MKIKLYQKLAYAGTLPFVFCALFIMFDINKIFWLGEVRQILSVYSLIITSFIAGSHWGIHLNLKDKLYLPVSSNLNAIFLWVAFLAMPFKLMLVVFGASFLVLLLIDKHNLKLGLISKTYFSTRFIATGVALLSLSLAFIYS